MMLYDMVIACASFFLALMLRFDFVFSKVGEKYWGSYRRTILIYALVSHVIFFLLRMYKSIWRFASYVELMRLCMATAFTFIANIVITLLFGVRMPVSYYVFGSCIQFLLMAVIRFGYRFIQLERNRVKKEAGGYDNITVIIAESD